MPTTIGRRWRATASASDRALVERASPTDRAFLAMDTPAVPEQFGVILVLDDAGRADLDDIRRLIAQRIPAVPRLRQRLVQTPVGCGGPIWIDDPGFDVREHVRAMACPAAGDERSLLDAVADIIATPLDLRRPLWSAVLVTGLADGSSAVVVVLHHVLADGIGGIAVLGSLVDPGRPIVDGVFPRPRPSATRLAQDALVRRARAVRSVARSWRLVRTSMAAGGGFRPSKAAPCSLIRPAGARRRIAVSRTDHAMLRAAAHANGATTNDAVLVAVAGALRRLLLARHESLDEVQIAVPVSGRRETVGSDLGNMVSPMLVRVPATGPVGQRLAQVSAAVRAHKAGASGPPPIALLGWMFRWFAILGGYHWYMNHQRRFHTLVSHIRGPAETVSFAGYRVGSAIPAGVGEGGNVPVSFEVFSYAGTLTLTAIFDPGRLPDVDTLIDGLRDELNLIARAATPAG